MIQVYNIIGIGYIIGEVITPSHVTKSVMLQYPAGLQNRIDSQGNTRVNLVPAYPQFFKNWQAMMAAYSIPKDKIMHHDEPSAEIESAYKDWQIDIRSEISGIVSPNQSRKSVGRSGIVLN